MKPLFIILLAISWGIQTNASNEGPSTQIIKEIDRLSPSQRNLLLKRYGKTEFSSTVGQNNLSSQSSLSKQDTAIVPEDSLVQPNDHSNINNKISTRLRNLYALEAKIQADLKEMELDMSDPQGPVKTAELEAYKEDRMYDLTSILKEIKGLQLAVISKSLDEGSISTEAKLFPFGYSSFGRTASRQHHYFQLNSTHSAFPSNYKIGPGDMLEIHLYGQKDDQYSLAIGSGGILSFPEIGPINILERGISFEDIKNLIKERVNQKFGGGVQVYVGLAGLRQIRVFLAGEFNEPGQTLVYAGSSLSNLLMDSGGVTEIASLRSLTLKRKGSQDLVLDLYDLLLKGEFTDVTMEEGDIVFLPTVKSRVWVDGEVLRPAIYEFRENSSLADVVGLAGGATNKAKLTSVQLYRPKSNDGFVGLKTLNMSSDSAMKIVSGDRIEVGRVSERNFLAISVEGEAEHQGKHEWFEGQRVSDILGSKAHYSEDADFNYALIRRKGFSGRVSIISFSPNKVLEAPDSDDDLLL